MMVFFAKKHCVLWTRILKFRYIVPASDLYQSGIPHDDYYVINGSVITKLAPMIYSYRLNVQKI